MTTGRLSFDSGYTTKVSTERPPCFTVTHSEWRGDFASFALAQSCAKAACVISKIDRVNRKDFIVPLLEGVPASDVSQIRAFAGTTSYNGETFDGGCVWRHIGCRGRAFPATIGFCRGTLAHFGCVGAGSDRMIRPDFLPSRK